MLYIRFVILILNLGFILGEDAPTITIPDGELVGSVGQTVGDNTTYYSYRGIPYAQEPVGNLRFADPVPNDPWNGTLDATEDQDPCTQLYSSTIIGSENCLFINVYTTSATGNLPVMVWIYGGGFTKGSSAYSWYGPDYIIEKDVIYVAFNYRLGVFGFLSTEDESAYGNWGLKDAILALKWVKKNIQYFGGDPNKVTIFGESAGAASVSYLLQSRLTKGLFNRAIIQSGTSLSSWTLARNASAKAFKVGELLKIEALTSESLITQLRAVDYRVLKYAEISMTTTAFLSDNILAGLPVAVVLEANHPNAVVSQRSHLSLGRENIQKNIDIIVGYNSNELGSLSSYVDMLRSVLDLYDADISRLAPADLTTNLTNKLEAGTLIRNKYLGSSVVNASSDDIIYFASNDLFNRPTREYVRLMSMYNKVYMYLFDYKGTLGNPSSTYAGVGHAEDLEYIFVSSNSATEADIATRNKIVSLWTSFAKTGNPTPLRNNAALDNVRWEPNTLRRCGRPLTKFLYINDTLLMGRNPDQEDWDFYQTIYRTYGNPPYGTY